MKKISITLVLAALVFAAQLSLAQVVISDDGSNTSDDDAVLNVISSGKKGVKLPVVEFTSFIDPLPDDANEGIMIYGIDKAYTPVRAGLYYSDPSSTQFGIEGWFFIQPSGTISVANLTDCYVNETDNTLSVGRDLSGTAGDFINNTFLGFVGDVDSPGTLSHDNTLVGYKAGSGIGDEAENTLIGSRADVWQGPATGGTAIGYDAGVLGGYSTAIGYQAKASNRSTAIGSNAVVDIDHDYSTAIGHNAQTTGENQIMLGTAAQTVFVPGNAEVTGSIKIADVLKLTPRAQPGSAEEGDLYVGTDNHIYCYLGGVWKQLD